MQNEFFQSYMNFAYTLYTLFCYALSVLIVVVGSRLAWFIAFGKGVLTIQIGHFILIELDLTDKPTKK